MATVKLKFRPSTVKGGEGTLYYRVIHGRVARQISTTYKLRADEWDKDKAEIVLTGRGEERKRQLLALHTQVVKELGWLREIISILEKRQAKYTSDDVITQFSSSILSMDFFSFAQTLVSRLKSLGKIRLSESYTSALNSLRRFLSAPTLLFTEIDSDLMVAYEAHLKETGISMNTSSFYMRGLRAIYNRAVEKRLTEQQHPFKHVYTGVEKTKKRALTLKVIRQIKTLDLSAEPSLEFARDMFIFSFYTRGMAFVDMAYLKKTSLRNGILSYRRRKTGQQLFVKWEEQMQEIIDRYDTGLSPYLLPIIRSRQVEERKQYINRAHIVNRHLKTIGRRLNLPLPLTLYCARHSWASIAKSKHIPISVISESMGHDSENTTRIYLASLNKAEIDKANKMILKLI